MMDIRTQKKHLIFLGKKEKLLFEVVSRILKDWICKLFFQIKKKKKKRQSLNRSEP